MKLCFALINLFDYNEDMGYTQYMDQVVRSPGEFIRDELEVRKWTQDDLARILKRPLPTINQIVQGKRAILPEMAIELGAAFGTDPEVWMQREATYRLALAACNDEGVRRRARLYDLAPVREMIRRGWISAEDELAELEVELKRFFGVESLDDVPSLTVATRRSEPLEELTPSQRAWCFRARNLAADLITPPFDPARLDECEARLRMLLAFAPETRLVPRTLTDFGIRFVVVQPLSDSKIDGATMWLATNKPVIALSMRMDRIDSFWYTLFHEFSHVRHGDGSVDSNLTGEDAVFSGTKPQYERRADEEAAASLIPPEKITSFIQRLAPFYSKDRIIQFAHRIKVHPGIIVGQLQHRGEVRYRSNREMLVKVRDKVTAASVTDGWGTA